MRTSILIVDDEFGLAEVVSELLEESGYATRIAINGRLALKAMEEERPDLLICDVMMPVLGGPEMLRIVRQTAAWEAIPAILMTAMPHAIARDEPPLHQALLVKPFSPDHLFEAVERLLNGRRVGGGA